MDMTDNQAIDPYKVLGMLLSSVEKICTNIDVATSAHSSITSKRKEFDIDTTEHSSELFDYRDMDTGILSSQSPNSSNKRNKHAHAPSHVSTFSSSGSNNNNNSSSRNTNSIMSNLGATLERMIEHSSATYPRFNIPLDNRHRHEPTADIPSNASSSSHSMLISKTLGALPILCTILNYLGFEYVVRNKLYLVNKAWFNRAFCSAEFLGSHSAKKFLAPIVDIIPWDDKKYVGSPNNKNKNKNSNKADSSSNNNNKNSTQKKRPANFRYPHLKLWKAPKDKLRYLYDHYQLFDSVKDYLNNNNREEERRGLFQAVMVDPHTGVANNFIEKGKYDPRCNKSLTILYAQFIPVVHKQYPRKSKKKEDDNGSNNNNNGGDNDNDIHEYDGDDYEDEEQSDDEDGSTGENSQTNNKDKKKSNKSANRNSNNNNNDDKRRRRKRKIRYELKVVFARPNLSKNRTNIPPPSGDHTLMKRIMECLESYRKTGLFTPPRVGIYDEMKSGGGGGGGGSDSNEDDESGDSDIAVSSADGQSRQRGGSTTTMDIEHTIEKEDVFDRDRILRRWSQQELSTVNELISKRRALINTSGGYMVFNSSDINVRASQRHELFHSSTWIKYYNSTENMWNMLETDWQPDMNYTIQCVQVFIRPDRMWRNLIQFVNTCMESNRLYRHPRNFTTKEFLVDMQRMHHACNRMRETMQQKK